MKASGQSVVGPDRDLRLSLFRDCSDNALRLFHFSFPLMITI
jgi:hypothetical protein